MDQQQHIDALLERYLGLLDEYTQLRKSLSQLQSNVYQNIARANFAGERGMRYGQDQYDERMQAIRLLDIKVDDNGIPAFSVIDTPAEGPEKEEDTAAEGNGGESEDKGDDKTKEPTQKKPKNKNPLHWYGIFAPMPLRTAQTQSVQAVEEIIPRLVSVNAEMLNVEIEVRRARKRRAKAEAAAKNEGETTATTQPQTAPLAAS